MHRSNSPARFSVLLAAFNAAPFIARAIESVFGQTYAAHEIIVVDDGSTDGTADVVGGFGQRVRYHRQANAGVSAARNTAAGLATGEWLAFLDADDWYYPERIRWHAELLARYPNLDLLSGDFDYRNADGSLVKRSGTAFGLGRELIAAGEGDGARVLEGPEIARFVGEYFGHIQTLSMPRRLFLELGGFPAGFPVAEDLHLFVRACARAHRVGIVTTPMSAYVVHEQSAVRRDPERAQREAVRALVDLRQSLGGAPSSIQQAARSLLRDARLNFATATLRSHGRLAAVRAALPLILEHPRPRTLRDLAALCLR